MLASPVKLGSPVRKTAELADTKNFPDALAEAVNPVARVIIVTDAGVLTPYFQTGAVS